MNQHQIDPRIDVFDSEDHQPRSITKVVGTLGVIVFAAVAVFQFAQSKWDTAREDRLRAQITAHELETVRAMQQEARALARSRANELERDIENIRELASALNVELKRWETEVRPLLDNDAGKAIAANPTYVAAFLELSSHVDLKDKTLPAFVSVSLDDLSQVISSSVGSDTGYLPQEEFTKRLSSLDRRVRETLFRYRDARQQIQSMAIAGRESSSTGSSSQTLRAALANLRREHAEERTRAITQKANLERKRADQAAAAQAAEAERYKARRAAERHQAQQASLQRQAEQQRLRRLAADPSVQAQFQPFLADGLDLPKTQWTRPAPMSFSLMKQYKTLDNTENFVNAGHGRRVLYNTGGHGYYVYWSANDRPHWANYPRSNADWREWDRKFKLFKELAPIWVETGVLQP